MTATLRELSTTDEVAALEPMVLEYFRVVCGFLKSDFDAQISPSEPTENMMAALDKFVPPKGRGYVAEEEGALIGMIFLKTLRENAYEVKRLYLRNEARGRVLGSEIASYDMLREHGIYMHLSLKASGTDTKS